jgi:plastocyanin
MTESQRHPAWAAVAICFAGIAIALLLASIAPGQASSQVSTAAGVQSGGPNANQANAGAAAQPGASAPTGQQPQTLAIKMGDYFFEPGTVSVSGGAIKATLTNGGDRRHALAVQNPATGAEVYASERIAPGDTVSVEFTLPAGSYRIFCPVSDHAERGQVGSLTVSA